MAAWNTPDEVRIISRVAIQSIERKRVLVQSAELSPIPSVGLSVCLSVCVSVGRTGGCTVVKRLIRSGCRLG